MTLTKHTLTVAGAAVIVAGLGTTPALSAEVTLRGASCFPIGSPPSRPFEALVKAVNKRGKGVVQIKLLGGAPAIGSPYTLTQKMSKGAYDVVGCTEAYFGNIVPEAAVYRLATRTYAELRKNGGLAYMSKLMAAKNMHYVARHHDFGNFHLWLNKKNKITKPDLTGLNLRVAPVYTAFFQSLGATTQRSNIGQVYAYMENNTVQGFGWPAVAWVPAWAKVTKYRVDPGFYSATLHTLVNMRKWNSLTTAQQDVITQVGLQFERDSESSSPKFQAVLKKQLAWLASKGIVAITFKGANRTKWLTAADSAAWGEVFKRSPRHGRKLKALWTTGGS